MGLIAAMSCPSGSGRGRAAARRIEQAKQRLETQRAREQEQGTDDPPAGLGFELDLERLGDRRGGRRGWLRNGRRQLEEHRERDSRPVPRSRAERLEDAERRLEQQLAVDTATNAAYERYRLEGLDTQGRRLGARPKPVVTPVVPEGTVNPSDPDSRVMRTLGQPTVQGYNVQATVIADQIIVAAEITTESPDFGHLEPVFNAAVRDRERAGVTQRPGTVLADAGYWHTQQMENITAGGSNVLVPPDQTSERAHARGGPAAAMTSCAACWTANTAASSTYSENRQSSRCSGTPSTTAGSGSSDDEAEAPHGRNGA